MVTEITKDEMREKLGNIGQIRDLLFGTQMREYEQQFQRLEGEISRLFSFKEAISERVDQLHQSLSQEISAVSDSLEKRLKYLSLTTHEEINKLSQEQISFDRKTSDHLEQLNLNFDNNVKSLKTEIATNREQLDNQIDSIKKILAEDLDKKFGKLQEIKVSRDDLAEVLFELCIKVKGTEFVPDLKDAADSKADFLLPDQQNQGKISTNGGR